MLAYLLAENNATEMYTTVSDFWYIFLQTSKKKTTLHNFRIAQFSYQLIMNFLVGKKGCIKMHTLIHNQLQAPVFRNMVCYAAKLVTSREFFCSKTKLHSQLK